MDLCITTRELARLIKQSGVAFKDLPDGHPDSILGTYSGGGLIFGATGGVMEAALRTAYFRVTGRNLEKEAVSIKAIRGLEGIRGATIDIDGTKVRVAVAHGLGNVEKLLLEIRAAREAGEEPPYHFIEVMACPGGCVGGGGQPYGVTNDLRTARARGLYDVDSTMTLRFSHENPDVLKALSGLSRRAAEPPRTRVAPRPLPGAPGLSEVAGRTWSDVPSAQSGTSQTIMRTRLSCCFSPRLPRRRRSNHPALALAGHRATGQDALPAGHRHTAPIF